MGKIKGISFSIIHKIVKSIQPRVGFMMDASRKRNLN
jgi:hypothetical protein